MMTKAGGKNIVAANVKKFGSYENWKAHLKKIASKGGKNGTGHAFAHGKLDPVEMGKRAGRNSKRRWTPELRQEMSEKIKDIRAHKQWGNAPRKRKQGEHTPTSETD